MRQRKSPKWVAVNHFHWVGAHFYPYILAEHSSFSFLRTRTVWFNLIWFSLGWRYTHVATSSLMQTPNGFFFFFFKFYSRQYSTRFQPLFVLRSAAMPKSIASSWWIHRRGKAGRFGCDACRVRRLKWISFLMCSRVSSSLMKIKWIITGMWRRLLNWLAFVSSAFHVQSRKGKKCRFEKWTAICFLLPKYPLHARCWPLARSHQCLIITESKKVSEAWCDSRGIFHGCHFLWLN